jgi:hypothetical protein
MRQILNGQINSFNREYIEVSALDGPGPGGASHHYRIDVYKTIDGDPNHTEGRGVAEFQFQNGAVKEAGPNGITDEALLGILIDRLQGFQSGKYSCRENALALTKMEEAMHWLQARTQARERRGVEGTMAV